LPNRELFFDRIDAALTLAQTESKIRPAILSIDIDRFKQINEASGLSSADSILLTVARRLSRILKPQDTLARLSGDQFAVLIVSEFETSQISALANLVRRVVSTPVIFSDKEIPLTASIGLALYDPQLHATREDMLKDAEIAMRHGKRLGGNRIEVFRPTMRSLRTDRLGLDADLRKALDRGEIKVLFQPIVRLEDRTVAGFEALLRWIIAPWAAWPRRIHCSRRRNRDHYRARHFRAGAHGARACRLATRARRRSADFRERQYLLAPIAPPRSPVGCQGVLSRANVIPAR